MKNVGLFAVKDIISDTFESGLIPASNALVAMRGFVELGKSEKDPVNIKEKALYCCGDFDPDTYIIKPRMELVCNGSNVDERIKDFLANFDLED